MYLLRDSVSSSSGWPRIYYVNQDDLKLLPGARRAGRCYPTWPMWLWGSKSGLHACYTGIPLSDLYPRSTFSPLQSPQYWYFYKYLLKTIRAFPIGYLKSVLVSVHYPTLWFYVSQCLLTAVTPFLAPSLNRGTWAVAANGHNFRDSQEKFPPHSSRGRDANVTW